MSNLFVDKISGKSGTSSGAPITLSGDTATLGSGVTIPAAGITGTLGSGVFPVGHIIATGYTPVPTRSTYNSATFTGTPLQIDHVAKASGSHIYICVHVNLSYNNATSLGLKIQKDDTDVASMLGTDEQSGNIPVNISFYHHSAGTNYSPFSNIIQTMDQTGAIVAGTTYNYRVYLYCGDAQTIYINRGATTYSGSTERAVFSSIYLAEIAQ